MRVSELVLIVLKRVLKKPSNCEVSSTLQHWQCQIPPIWKETDPVWVNVPWTSCTKPTFLRVHLSAMASTQLCPGFLLQVFAVPRQVFLCWVAHLTLVRSNHTISWLVKHVQQARRWTKHGIARPSKSANPGFGFFFEGSIVRMPTNTIGSQAAKQWIWMISALPSMEGNTHIQPLYLHDAAKELLKQCTHFQETM